MPESFWKDRVVFVTGHTGFKGSWLSFMLAELGAKVHGYSLSPHPKPNLFELAHIREILASHTIGDIRDLPGLTKALQEVKPEVIFHLAAQPLVIESYKTPIDTLTANVIGTAHVLEAARLTPSLSAIVVITTDKVYENKEWLWGYRENDRLGGKDPYSASKACAEIVVDSYRASFFQSDGCLIASARAGNIVGGGDWSDNRILPDIIRAVESKTTLAIRSPASTRPWQHVIEPLFGYLALGESLLKGNRQDAGAWNFGPSELACQSVHYLCEQAKSYYGPRLVVEYASSGPILKESKFLKLDSSKAKNLLGWSTKLTVDQALKDTFIWHDMLTEGRKAADLMQKQISLYQSL